MTQLIHYAIRDIKTKKYYRSCYPRSDTYELISGINRAQGFVQDDDGGYQTALYVIEKHELKDCEIIAFYDHENLNRNRKFNREIKGTVWSTDVEGEI